MSKAACGRGKTSTEHLAIRVALDSKWWCLKVWGQNLLLCGCGGGDGSGGLADVGECDGTGGGTERW